MPTPETLRHLAEQAITEMGDVFYTPDPVTDGYTAADLHARLVGCVVAALTQALGLPPDTGERYSNVYWTVDDLLDPGCNGLAVNWDEMTAHACLAALQDDVAQAMCEAGWEHLEIWVPLWARRNNAPVPIPYDSEDAEDYANTDNYDEDDFDPGDDYAGDDYDGGW